MIALWLLGPLVAVLVDQLPPLAVTPDNTTRQDLTPQDLTPQNLTPQEKAPEP